MYPRVRGFTRVTFAKRESFLQNENYGKNTNNISV